MKQPLLPLVLDIEKLVEKLFTTSGVVPIAIERRAYPEETIFIVRVSWADYDKAGNIANQIDRELSNQNFKGFVTVRKQDFDGVATAALKPEGIADLKVGELTNLITARARTSEIQPSLQYILDTERNIELVLQQRHQLIFGRRGAGKTALMVEAKRRVVDKGNAFVWINLQTLRTETASKAYVFICQRICEAVQSYFSGKGTAPGVLAANNALNEDLEAWSKASQVSATTFVPRIQQIIKRFLDSTQIRLYIFIDELHYLARSEQPILLDMIHGSVRDCDAWLKVAGIRHLSHWFQAHPPVGLQTGHDTDHIDLDLTLENPTKAKTFLEAILLSYAKRAGITKLSSLFSNTAIDRLVLASGAVPRDFLVLSAGAIKQAQQREKAKNVGVQDVNKSAGDTAKVKLAELEDDAASTEGTSKITNALNRVRDFCLDDKKYTYFRIDFRDKEKRTQDYGLIQDLMDLRLIHLIDSSLSDKRQAGRRSEVYMLDLSQFSGQRLKKRLKVLDFEAGHITLRETGTNMPSKIGTTPHQRLGLLRRGPLFELQNLSIP